MKKFILSVTIALGLLTTAVGASYVISQGMPESRACGTGPGCN